MSINPNDIILPNLRSDSELPKSAQDSPKPNPKPPLGLKPTNVWLLERQMSIIAASTRDIEAGVEIPTSWLIELGHINKYLETIKDDESSPPTKE